MAGELHDGTQEAPKSTFVNQGTLVPTPKVAATGVAGGLAIVIIWVAGQFGLVIPPEVAAAFTGLLASAGAYFQKDKL